MLPTPKQITTLKGMTTHEIECSMCVITKPEQDFPYVHGERRGRVCKSCRNADLRCRRQGITLLAWRSIWNAQAGRCGVCRDVLDGLARVDANAGLVIRGLVCRPCYAWLRARGGDVAIERAAGYVYGSRMGQIRAG